MGIFDIWEDPKQAAFLRGVKRRAEYEGDTLSGKIWHHLTDDLGDIWPDTDISRAEDAGYNLKDTDPDEYARLTGGSSSEPDPPDDVDEDDDDWSDSGDSSSYGTSPSVPVATSATPVGGCAPLIALLAICCCALVAFVFLFRTFDGTNRTAQQNIYVPTSPNISQDLRANFHYEATVSTDEKTMTITTPWGPVVINNVYRIMPPVLSPYVDIANEENLSILYHKERATFLILITGEPVEEKLQRTGMVLRDVVGLEPADQCKLVIVVRIPSPDPNVLGVYGNFYNCVFG